MNVVDSSCWLEYFAGSELGERLAPIVQKIDELLVPSIIIYEVFKKLLNELDEDRALFAIAHMKQGIVMNLDADLAVYSAKVGKELKLAMADSMIYAAAKKFDAILWTKDKHFKSLDSVKYFE